MSRTPDRPLRFSLVPLLRLVVLVTSIPILAFATPADAATPVIVDGKLAGARNVVVNGALYDVEFVDGTCIALLSGCDELSDFTFPYGGGNPANPTDPPALAAQALIDQVFVGAYANAPASILGCAEPMMCIVATGYYSDGLAFVFAALTFVEEATAYISSWTAFPPGEDTTPSDITVFARWTPVESGDLLATLDTPGIAAGVDVVANAAYVADGSSMRQILVNDPEMPVDFASFPTPGAGAVNVAVSGTYAYIANGLDGLRVVNHSNMMQVALLDPPAWFSALDVKIVGDTAYVASGLTGLRIVDITSPGVPLESGFFDTGGFAYGVTVEGDLAYVADDTAGLRILDVSNPAAPFEVGFAPTSNAEEVALDDTVAYVADRGAGLRLIDVSTPASPIELALVDTPGTARGVDVLKVPAGTFAVVADFTGKLRLIDTTNPASPIPIGVIASVGNVIDVEVVGNLAYVVGSEGLEIVELPFPLTEFTGPDLAADLVLDTPYASTADSPWALGAVDFSAGYFHLEDFETADATTPITTPGATGLFGGPMSVECCPTDHDSVDADDGAIDGSGLAGESWYTANGANGVRFQFDGVALGTLPTHAGFVFTDGSIVPETLTFEAYDATGASLGTLAAAHDEASNSGTTAEDRFFGAVHLGGISAVRMSHSGGGGLEVDHLQYGTPVPEPAAQLGLVAGVVALAVLRRRRHSGRGA